MRNPRSNNGAKPAATPVKEMQPRLVLATLALSLAAMCEAVVSCVSADADVLEVTRALAPALRKGTLMLDCSTVSAATARQAAELVGARGADFLDCPVSGGVEGARDGTLAIMVGGSPDAFERAQPILQALGRTIAHFGPVGAGESAKATSRLHSTTRRNNWNSDSMGTYSDNQSPTPTTGATCNAPASDSATGQEVHSGCVSWLTHSAR